MSGQILFPFLLGDIGHGTQGFTCGGHRLPPLDYLLRKALRGMTSGVFLPSWSTVGQVRAEAWQQGLTEA